MNRFALAILITILSMTPCFAQSPEPPAQPAPATATAAAPAPQAEAVPDNPCMKAEMKSGKDARIERFYPAPPDKVKQAVVDAMKAIEVNVDKQTDTEVQGQRKRHFGVMVGGGGEVLNVQFAPATEGGVGGTKVTAETKKTFAGRVGQRNWTDAVLQRADCLLKAQK